ELRIIVAGVPAERLDVDKLAEAVEIAGVGGRDRDLGQRLLEAELAQLLAGVRQDIDADAERLDLRRGLVDAAGDAAPLQHEPEREPAYAAADDQYFHDSLRNTTI